MCGGVTMTPPRCHEGWFWPPYRIFLGNAQTRGLPVRFPQIRSRDVHSALPAGSRTFPQQPIPQLPVIAEPHQLDQIPVQTMIRSIAEMLFPIICVFARRRDHLADRLVDCVPISRHRESGDEHRTTVVLANHLRTRRQWRNERTAKPLAPFRRPQQVHEMCTSFCGAVEVQCHRSPVSARPSTPRRGSADPLDVADYYSFVLWSFWFVDELVEIVRVSGQQNHRAREIQSRRRDYHVNRAAMTGQARRAEDFSSPAGDFGRYQNDVDAREHSMHQRPAMPSVPPPAVLRHLRRRCGRKFTPACWAAPRAQASAASVATRSRRAR